MEAILEARSLVDKDIKRVTLSIYKGEVFGLLGPKGCGYEQLFEIFRCEYDPEGGELFVSGLNAKENPLQVKGLVGSVTSIDALDEDFCVLDNLIIFARFSNLSIAKAKVRAREVLRFVGLEEIDNLPVFELSEDQKQRLTFARAILANPKILFLHEPNKYLTSEGRVILHRCLQQLNQNGCTIVISTSEASEIQNLCKRICIMSQGEILVTGNCAELIQENVGRSVVEFSVPEDEVEYFVKKVRSNFEFHIYRNRVRIFLASKEDVKSALSLIPLEDIVVRKPSLDDVFLKLAGYDLKGKINGSN